HGAACALHLAQSCVAPLSTCIRLFTPPGGTPKVAKDANGWSIVEPEVGEADDRYVMLTDEGRSFEPRKGATRQQAIIDALKNGELRVAELRMEFGAVSSVLSALEKRGIVRIEHRRRNRGVPAAGEEPRWAYGQVALQVPELTEGQRQALLAIQDATARADGSAVLVDGVTGSGKTEVYLRAIEPVLAAGKRVLVLVPEISLTPQTVARFRGRFGDRVAVMHSRMGQGERYDQWDFIRSGAAKVVVGARSALFTPLADIGMIIIDEEHETSYKQDSAPRYHARDVALWMAKRHGATLVLGSATPSIESLYQCATQESWTRVVLPDRVNGRPLPPVEVIDMAAEFRDGSRAMFSHRLTNLLRDALMAGQKAILLLNQRGFAKFVLCRDCGFVPECPHCATSLTYHESEGLLLCHHCGHAERMPARCPKCASPYMRLFGAGTQRVEAELRALITSFGLPEVRVVRMDADTTRKKGSHQTLLEEFMAPGAAVLLGTQMIAKGLDFDDVTLVGVINADTMLKVPDFRSGEATYDLLEQVAGRAGRAALDGRVVVQTYWAGSSAIQAVCAHDRRIFLREELPKRKALRYPPYVRMANILIWGKDAGKVKREAEELYRGVIGVLETACIDDWMVLPATPCALSKLRNTYRWHIVMKAPVDADIASVVEPYFRERRTATEVRAAVDIDPISML
ncbi:MAG: primosomal protein N', partial [Coriobacteriia bacterium]|nr:primosomal protein N' [Coriobacteriia bacterium]